DLLQGGQGVLALAHQDGALDLVLLVLPDPVAVPVDDVAAAGVHLGSTNPHLAQPGLVGDDYTPVAGLARGRVDGAPGDEVLDADGHVVDRGDDDLADLAEAALLLAAQVPGRGSGDAAALRRAEVGCLGAARLLGEAQGLGGGRVGVLHRRRPDHRVLASAHQADCAHAVGVVTQV